MSAGSVAFETNDEIYVWPLDSAAVGKTPAPASDGSRAEEDRRDDAQARLRPAAIGGCRPSTTPTQLPADPAAPDAVPLDVSSTLDHSLWIAVLRKKITDVEPARRTAACSSGSAFDEKVAYPARAAGTARPRRRPTSSPPPASTPTRRR